MAKAKLTLSKSQLVSLKIMVDHKRNRERRWLFWREVGWLTYSNSNSNMEEGK
jgi:hypothetical protein